MAFNFEQVVQSALNLAQKQYEELEKEVGDKRIHQNPSRYKQRRVRDFIEEKYNASLQDFKILFRLSRRQFDKILTFIFADLEDLSKKAVIPRDKLAIFLLFSSGLSMEQISALTNFGTTTVREAIRRVALSIVENMAGIFMALPTTEEEWLEVSAEFETRTCMPNCIGSIDGKHVKIQKPGAAGSQFWNYKNFHSIILMAVADARYRFTWAEIGSCGSNNDAYVFTSGEFCKAVNEDRLHIPGPSRLPNSNIEFPHFFVGDDAFALRHWLYKPFKGDQLTAKQHEYNYRITLARRTVEQAFGILATRFTIFSRAVMMGIDSFKKVVMALLVLHNFLLSDQLPDFDEIENPKTVILQARIVDEPDIQLNNPNLLRQELLRYLTHIAPIPEQIGRNAF